VIEYLPVEYSDIEQYLVRLVGSADGRIFKNVMIQPANVFLVEQGLSLKSKQPQFLQCQEILSINALTV
jgi:hypothetical protein